MVDILIVYILIVHFVYRLRLDYLQTYACMAKIYYSLLFFAHHVHKQ